MKNSLNPVLDLRHLSPLPASIASPIRGKAMIIDDYDHAADYPCPVLKTESHITTNDRSDQSNCTATSTELALLKAGISLMYSFPPVD